MLFIKLDGVPGDSKDTDHKDWSDLSSFSQGSHVLPGIQQTKGTPRFTVGDLTVAMPVDRGFITLILKAFDGDSTAEVEIHDTATFGGARKTILSYKLKQVYVTALSLISRSEGDALPAIVVTLKFRELKVQYVQYDNEGVETGKFEAAWDVAKAQA